MGWVSTIGLMLRRRFIAAATRSPTTFRPAAGVMVRAEWNP